MYEEQTSYNSKTQLYQCKKCHKTTKRKDTILNHYEATHSDIVAYTCEFCELPYKSLNSLRAHTYRHHRQDLNSLKNPNLDYYIDDYVDKD